MRLVYLVAICFVGQAMALTVTSPATVANQTFDAPIASTFLGLQNWTIVSGNLTELLTDACTSISFAEATGNVVVTENRLCSLGQRARLAAKTGAVAMIAITDLSVPGSCAFCQEGDDSTVDIPIVEVSRDDIDPYLALLSSSNVSVAIYPESNPWQEMKESDAHKLLFQYILAGWNFLNFILAILFYVKHVHKSGAQRSMPQIGLGIECIASIIRAIYLAVDPFVSTGDINLASHHVLVSFSFPFSLTVTVVVAFFWKALGRPGKRPLQRARVPIIIVVSLLWIIEIANAATRALFLSESGLLYVAGALKIVTLVCAISFFVHQGRRILRGMFMISARKRDTATAEKDRSTRHRDRIAKWLLVSTITMSIMVVGTILQVSPLYGQPWGFFAANFVSTLGLTSTSFTHIFSFSPGTVDKKVKKAQKEDAMQDAQL